MRQKVTVAKCADNVITCYFVDICVWMNGTPVQRPRDYKSLLESCCRHCCWLADLKFEKCSRQKCLVESVTANLLLCPYVSSLVFAIFQECSDQTLSGVSLLDLTFFLFVFSCHMVSNIKFPDAVLNGLNLWMINSIRNQPFH